jgi:hypothetical protein
MPETFDFDGLQERFLAATDFSEFWGYFLDCFAEKREFMQLGAPAETEPVEVLIAYIAGKMLGRVVEPTGLRLAKIPEPGLVHGACMIEGNITCFLYFEKVEKGLLVATGDNGKTNYARFTWQFDRRPKWATSDNIAGSSGLPN